MRVTAVDRWWAAKCGQLAAAGLSIGLTLLLVRLCDRLGPGKTRPAVALGLLALCPVYFKSFAFVRGEPYVAFFTVLAVHLALPAFVSERATWRGVAGLGVTLGLLALSRQWGFAAIGALVAFVALQAVRDRERRGRLVARLSVTLALAAVVGGGFYLHLLKQHGRVTVFNRPGGEAISLANQPLHFYFGLGLRDLFRRPVADAFPNRLLPIFYSETWGDYWGFFVVYNNDLRTGRPVSGRTLVEARAGRPAWYETNRDRVAGYLGRVNVAGLAPALVLAAGLGMGISCLARFARTGDREASPLALLTLVILASLAGYLLFLVAYPNLEKGDTIKATYVLQVFPLAAVLGARALAALERRTRRGYRLVLLLLSVAFAHDLPVLVTRNVSLGP